MNRMSDPQIHLNEITRVLLANYRKTLHRSCHEIDSRITQIEFDRDNNQSVYSDSSFNSGSGVSSTRNVPNHMAQLKREAELEAFIKERDRENLLHDCRKQGLPTSSVELLPGQSRQSHIISNSRRSRDLKGSQPLSPRLKATGRVSPRLASSRSHSPRLHSSRSQSPLVSRSHSPHTSSHAPFVQSPLTIQTSRSNSPTVRTRGQPRTQTASPSPLQSPRSSSSLSFSSRQHKDFFRGVRKNLVSSTSTSRSVSPAFERPSALSYEAYIDQHPLSHDMNTHSWIPTDRPLSTPNFHRPASVENTLSYYQHRDPKVTDSILRYGNKSRYTDTYSSHRTTDYDRPSSSLGYGTYSRPSSRLSGNLYGETDAQQLLSETQRVRGHSSSEIQRAKYTLHVRTTSNDSHSSANTR